MYILQENFFIKKNYYNKKEKFLLSNLKPSYFKYKKKTVFPFYFR